MTVQGSNIIFTRWIGNNGAVKQMWGEIIMTIVPIIIIVIIMIIIMICGHTIHAIVEWNVLRVFRASRLD